jgi:outer membrane protein OmpA-like peptidoglycan-associated protein/tetratricopeptide (TPR) repeat protein
MKNTLAGWLLSMIIIISFFIPYEANCQDNCSKTLDKKVGKIYDEGIASLKKGNYTLTRISMKSVLNAEPDFPDAWFVMGLTYYKLADPNLEEAEKCFLKVVSICPSYDVYTYYYLGEIAYNYERYDSAVQFLTTFLKDVDKIKTDQDYNRATDLLNYSKFYIDMIHHPVPFRPVVVEGISTPENEYLASLSPDNLIAFYTRVKKIMPDRNSLVQTPRMKEVFMYSDETEPGVYGEGEEMPDPFNINDNEGGASLTADNNSLYYTVCKKNAQSGYENCDIYFSENVNGEWSKITSISDKINKANSWESQPSISTDGKTLYFISDRQGGYGGNDIYKSTREDNGEWGAPVNLGPTINSKGNEKSPFIHPDGTTLYFSSDGWPGMGGYDIFYTKLNDNGTFSKPTNLGYPINSPDNEIGFFVSTDGTKGFFASNKYSGKGGWDLYSFDLYEAARPEKVLFIKGTVKDESSLLPVKAKIELRNVETKKVREIPLDTNTGKYVAVTPFKNDYVMTIKKEGYVSESKYIARADTVFKAPANVDMDIKPIELNQSYRINDIYFAFNSFDLTPESKIVLDQFIEFLNLNPALAIEIQGHTDNIGNDAENLKLSSNRAKSVFDYLVQTGISPERLTYKGFGKTKPIASNDSEEGRAKNRRTVFLITRK